MIFEHPLQEAILLRRYKRFLADVRRPDGSEFTLHCPNTGAMTHCQGEGWRVWYTDSQNPKRKYACTWQLVEDADGCLIGINSALANTLVGEALDWNVIKELAGYSSHRREVTYGEHNSRIDFLLAQTNRDEILRECLVEVKSLTLKVQNGLGVFPDAATTRGQKHLQELTTEVKRGKRAVLLFCVQHTGIERVSVAREIDAEYARLLEAAVGEGVEVLAYGVAIDPAKNALSLAASLPVEL
ncbi:MAG: DNA/RNA nuclease SfsA [Pseudomonadales bacterium]|nr:DNA/RNA nuclease SfsA [Pseudomonadales bacterium]